METLIVVLIITVAAAYVGWTFYKQFKGKAGCSSGCGCSSSVKSMCNDPRKSMENLKLK